MHAVADEIPKLTGPRTGSAARTSAPTTARRRLKTRQAKFGEPVVLPPEGLPQHPWARGWRTLESHADALHAQAVRGRGSRTKQLTPADADEVVRAFGSRAKADEITKAFGFTLPPA